MTQNDIALMIIDVQYAIDDPSWGRRGQPEMEANIVQLLNHWRAKQQPIIHIRHDSVEPQSPYRPNQKGNDFKQEVSPLPDEIIIPKTTNSAFINTTLQDYLGEHHIQKLVIVGVLLENSVGATIRMAGNLGYDVLVPIDGVASTDRTDINGRVWSAEDVHALELALLSGEYATITDTKSLLD